MPTVVVTGAAGFIGSHTCELLLAGGYAVVAIDNFRTGRRENLPLAERSARFRLLEMDVTDFLPFDAAISQIKPAAIIHLAALVSVPESIADPATNFLLNVRATQFVAETACNHGVKRVVFASSAAVYGNAATQPISESIETHPISPYGEAKLSSEAWLTSHAAASGFTACCLRYFNVYGPRQDPRSSYSGVISKFCDGLRAGIAPTIFGDGEQTRDFISVHDVARANVIAATTPSPAMATLNICSGRATSLNRLAAALRKLFPNAPPASYLAERPGDIRSSLGSPALAQTELGFSAEISLEAGLAELVKWRGAR